MAGSTPDLIPIESRTRTIQTCFQQCLYEVPEFQRPYSWGVDQLQDYWDDVVLAKGEFFFGSTVTWVSQKRELFNDTYSIIDGQQRLTTSAILLSVLRDAFLALGDDASNEEQKAGARAQVEATQRYLIAEDDDGAKYRVITRSEPMFYEVIQQPGAIPSGVEWNQSAERIGLARKTFETNVMKELQELGFDARMERLKTLRANVLRARVIQVELSSEEDGFLIFETLNTRGADLRLADLVKNLLIRGGASVADDRSTIAGRWDRCIGKVQSGRVNPDAMDRFIWQSWNSRRAAVKEPELFKEISKMVAGSSEQHLAYLTELEADAETYRYLEDEDVRVKAATPGVRDPFVNAEFVDALRALAIFNVSVANSATLAIARKYREHAFVTDAQLVRVIRLVENFHFQFTALTNSGSTGGTRSRYNRFAVRLEAASSRATVTAAIDDLEQKLKSSLPDAEQAKKAFTDLFYAPKLPLTQAQKVRARKTFVAYVLMGFAKAHKLLPAGQHLPSWSIEHIKPQAGAPSDVTDAVYSIGNLTLLTAALNSELGDATLSEKIEALRAGSAYFDPELKRWARLKMDSPTDQEISARADQLAEEALTKVWSL